MKKVIAAILSSVMVLSIAACSSSSSSESESSSKKSSTKIVSNSKETEDKNEKKSSKDATIEETVLVNESGIKITATKLSYDGIFGPELGLLIENDSGQDLTFQTRNESVNGFMVDTIFSPELNAGKRAVSSITLSGSGLEQNGISNIETVELSFHIFESSGMETIADTDMITLNF